MIDGKMLHQISQGIQAAEKVRRVYASNASRGSDVAVIQDSVSILAEMLSVIAAYYPHSPENRLNDVIEKSSKYCRNYRDVKNHFRSIKSGETDSIDIIKTLKVLSPILGSRTNGTIDRVLLLIEAMNYT